MLFIEKKLDTQLACPLYWPHNLVLPATNCAARASPPTAAQCDYPLEPATIADEQYLQMGDNVGGNASRHHGHRGRRG
jgi:hypothetical protein